MNNIQIFKYIKIIPNENVNSTIFHLKGGL